MFFPDINTEAQDKARWDAYKPEASIGEIFLAAMGQGRDMSLGGKLDQILDIEQFKKDSPDLVSADEANKLLPDIDVPFTEDVTQGEINFHQTRLDDNKNRQKIIDGAGDGFFKGTVLPFAGSAIGAFADPIDVAVGTLTGWGAGKAAATIISKSATLATSKLATSAFGLTMAEALAGNVVAEVGVSLASKKTREDYGIDDAVLNAIVGTTMMTGAFSAGNKLMSQLSKMPNKFMNNISSSADNLIAANKNPLKHFDIIDSAIKKVDTPSDEFAGLMRQRFPDKADELLELGSIESMKRLRGEDDFGAFVSDLQQVGDKRAVLATDDYNPKDILDDADYDNYNTHYNSPESDMTYDGQGKIVNEQVPPDYNGAFYDKQFSENVTKIEKTLDDTIDTLSEPSKLEFEAHKVASLDEDEAFSAFESYAKCVLNLG